MVCLNFIQQTGVWYCTIKNKENLLYKHIALTTLLWRYGKRYSSEKKENHYAFTFIGINLNIAYSFKYILQ